MPSQTSSGARVVFKLNGTKVAFANAVNYTLANAYQPVDILGQLEPAEYGPTGHTVNFTCTMFRVSNKDAVAQGLRPLLQQILTAEGLTVTLEDKISGKTIMQVEDVKCTQEDFNIDARSLGQLTLSFVGIKLSTEAGPAAASTVE